MLHWLLSNAVATLPFVLALLIAQRFITARPGVWNALWVIALVRLILPPVVDWPWSLSLPEAQPVVEKIVETDEMLFQKAWMLATLPDVVETIGEPLPEVIPAAPFPWLKLLLAAWALGAFALLVRSWLGVRRFHRIAREGIPADTLLNDEVQIVASRLRCNKPGVRVLAGILSPLVWALGKPTLYWPFGLEYRLNETGRRAVLTHELAHVKRRDHWVRRLEMFTALLHWWNPLFWIIRAQVRRTGELACDWWVVQTQPNQRRAYAEALLEVCRGWSPGSAPAVGIGTGGVKELERRLTMIMRSTGSQKRGKRAAIAVGLLGALALPGWSWGKPDDGKNFEVELALVEGDEKAGAEANQLFTLFRRFESADGAFEMVLDDKAAEPIKNHVQNGLKWLVTQNADASAKLRDLGTQEKLLQTKLSAIIGEIAASQEAVRKLSNEAYEIQKQIRVERAEGNEPDAKKLASQTESSKKVVALNDAIFKLLQNRTTLEAHLNNVKTQMEMQKNVVTKWNAAIAGDAKAVNVNDAIKQLKVELADKEKKLGKDHPETRSLQVRLARAANVNESIVALKMEMADRAATLGKDHPEVRSLQGRIERLVELEKTNTASGPLDALLSALGTAKGDKIALALKHDGDEAAKAKVLAMQAHLGDPVKAQGVQGTDEKAKAEHEAAIRKFRTVLDQAKGEADKAKDAEQKHAAALAAYTQALAQARQAEAEAAQKNALARAKVAEGDAAQQQAKLKADLEAHAMKFQEMARKAQAEAEHAKAEAERAHALARVRRVEAQKAEPADPVKEGFKFETRFVGPDGKEIKNVQGTQGAIKVEGKALTLDGKELKLGDFTHGPIKVEGKAIVIDGKEVGPFTFKDVTGTVKVEGGKLLTTDGKTPGTEDRILIWDAAKGAQHGNLTLSTKVAGGGKSGEDTITLTIDDKGNVLQSNVSGKPAAGAKTAETKTITITMDGKGNVLQSNVTGKPLGINLTEVKPINVQGGMLSLSNLAQTQGVKDVLIERAAPLAGTITVEGKPLETMTFRAVNIPLTDASVQPLERGTYKLPGKAEAVAKFIKENVKSKSIELTADKDTFTVTADPATQRIIGQFLSLLNPNISQAKPAALTPANALFAPAAPGMTFETRPLGIADRVRTMTVPAVPATPAAPAATAAPARVKVEAKTAPALPPAVIDKPIRIEMKLTDPTKPPVPPTPSKPAEAPKPASAPTKAINAKPAAEAPKPSVSFTKPAEKSVEVRNEVIAISAGKIKDNAERIEKLLKDGFSMRMDKNGDLVLEKSTKTAK